MVEFANYHLTRTGDTVKTRTKVLAGAGALVVVVGAAFAGPLVYRDFIAAPAAELPVLGAQGGVFESGEPLAAEALVGEWTLTTDSQVGYRVDEVLNDTEVTVTGRTSDVTGTLTVGESEGALLSLDAAEFTVDVASIVTDNPSRDSYFTERAIDTSQHPTAMFTLTEAISIDQLPDPGSVEQAIAQGALTMNGVTRDVEVEVAVRGDGQTTEIAGSIPITFADFGVIAPDFAFVKVEPTGFVEFQLTAQRP